MTTRLQAKVQIKDEAQQESKPEDLANLANELMSEHFAA